MELHAGDFIVLVVGGLEEYARIQTMFVHRGKDTLERLFVLVRWYVATSRDTKTTWDVLTERKVDAHRNKYAQVFSFLSVKRKASVEHMCREGCHVEQGRCTKFTHTTHDQFLVNPWMS